MALYSFLQGEVITKTFNRVILMYQTLNVIRIINWPFKATFSIFNLDDFMYFKEHNHKLPNLSTYHQIKIDFIFHN